MRQVKDKQVGVGGCLGPYGHELNILEQLLDEASGRQAKGAVSQKVGDLRVQADVIKGMRELLLYPEEENATFNTRHKLDAAAAVRTRGTLRQQARLVAFGPHGGAQVDDEAENLFPQQDSGGRAVV